MNRKYLLVFSLFILILTIGAVSAGDNQTDVDANDASSADETPIETVNGDKFSDIQTSISKAKDNDVIYLNGTYSGSKKAININKGVTIQGAPSATIDAKKLSSAFVIKTKKTVTLKNLNIINTIEGAVLSEYETVTSSNLIIINCTFKNNVNKDMYGDGGAICKTSNGKTTIINSTFANNKAHFGGALYISSTSLEIFNSKFTSNSATYQFGAVYASCDSLTVKDSTFTKNTAKESAGALAIINYDLCIAEVRNSTFNGNSAQTDGAIFSGSSLIVTDSTFVNNKATANSGGDISVVGELTIDEKINGYLKVINSTFKNSYAKSQGEAIYSAFNNLEIINSTINGNSSVSDIYHSVGDFKFVNSTCDSKKNITKLSATLKAKDLTTTYDSQARYEVELLYGGSGVMDIKLELRVYTGNTYKSYYGYTWDYGEHLFTIDSSMSLGKHKVVLLSKSKYYTAKSVTKYITIKKAKTTVKAPKMTGKYKKSKYFKATIRNKASGITVKNIKVKVKVYTGKKYRTLTLKTDKKGVVKFNIKKFKRGTHKVKITSKNKNYEISKIAYFKIK